MQTSAAETEKCRRKHMQEVSYTITTEEMPYMESTNSSPHTYPAKELGLGPSRVPLNPPSYLFVILDIVVRF